MRRKSLKRLLAFVMTMCMVFALVVPTTAADVTADGVVTDDTVTDGATGSENANATVSIYLEKTVYNLGEELAAVVWINTQSETENGISHGTTPDRISGYDPWTVGEQVVTVYYREYAQTFTVTVQDNAEDTGEVLDINIELNRDTYAIGEDIDAIVRGTRINANGEVEGFSSVNYTVTGYDPWMVGEQKIVISYGGYSYQFIVWVTEGEDVVSGTLEVYSNREIYYVGEELDLTVRYIENGMVIRELTREEYIIEGYDPYVAGDQEVRVIYADRVFALMVYVEGNGETNPPSAGDDLNGYVVGIRLNKTTYEIGESIDAVVYGKTYGADGNINEFTTTNFTVAGYDPYAPGTQVIQLSYADYSCEYTVTVVEKSGGENDIALEVYSNRDVYRIGEELDLTVMYYTADGMAVKVSREEYVVEGYDPYVAGDQEVRVIYADRVFTLMVYVEGEAVERVLESIRVDLNKDIYYVGEALDITVWACYSDGSVVTLSEAVDGKDGYIIDGYDPYVIGGQAVFIIYQGYEYVLKVSVVENGEGGGDTNAPIKAYSNRDVYYIGEELDITVEYYTADGMVVELTRDEYIVEGYDPYVTGEQEVRVIYGDTVVTFMVYVEGEAETEPPTDKPVDPVEPENPVPLELCVDFNEIVYYVGDELDITVYVRYSDGTERVVEDYRYTGFDSSKAGECYVTVYWGDFTCELHTRIENREDVGPTEPSVEEAVIYASDATTFTGSQEKIAISIRNNPGIAGYKIRVRYDNTVLTPVGIEAGDIALSGITSNIQDASADLSNLEFVSVVGYDSANVTGDGVLFYIIFDVAEDAAEGVRCDIILESNDLTDQMGEDVAFTLDDGFLDVLAALYGDANGDGEINTKDLVLMSQYVSGYEGNEYDSVFMKLGDVYKDGRINTKDMVLLSRYLADWQDVELGKAAQ